MSAGASQIHILVAIGNKVICESLCQTLGSYQTPGSSQPTYRCTTNIQNKSTTAPDIVLFNGAKTLEQLQNRYPEAKFILMDTGLNEQDITYLLLYHKIDGVIQPTTDMNMFLKALRVVLSGQIWIDNRHLKYLLHHNDSMTANGSIKALSQQDKNIVKLVAQGLKNKEIADQLYLSEHTIKAHIGHIFKKLNISRRTQLVSLYLESGLDVNRKQKR